MNIQTRSWIDHVLPLDRPEYAKQPESILTDLLWRSKGSSLASKIDLSRGGNLLKLVPSQERRGQKPDILETTPLLQSMDLSNMLLNQGQSGSPIEALLASIIAPKSKGDKSLACVPIHPDVAAFQTLHGLVNKPGPANLAKIVETVGWLGGSRGNGDVTWSLLNIMCQQLEIEQGFTGFVDKSLSLASSHVWGNLVNKVADPSNLPSTWPHIQPGIIELGEPSPISKYEWTPFRWFWEKWQALCDPQNGWYNVLPSRRFIDWALCLLRTGLSFAYLWEADFYTKVYACLVEELLMRNDRHSRTGAINNLHAMLQHGTTIVTFESPLIPASQKHVWNSVSTLLTKGYETRRRFEKHLDDIPFDIPIQADIEIIIQSWLSSLAKPNLEELAKPLQLNQNSSKNTREFVRYLLKPRSSDDDTRDQADFYYLACTNSKNFWFQPGPEWLVVITSLLSKQPGGKCTLGMLLRDLSMLGIRVDRWILVSMLEEAGLSTDSPDADSALVIHAGF